MTKINKISNKFCQKNNKKRQGFVILRVFYCFFYLVCLRGAFRGLNNDLS